MTDLFIRIFNVSLTAGLVVLALLLLRPLLKRAPAWLCCTLWGLVALRLLLPVSIESVLSLVPSASPVPEDIATSPTPSVHTGIFAINSTVNPVLGEHLSPAPLSSVTPMQTILGIAAIVWLVGIAIMLTVAVVSYIRLRRRVRPSVLREGNVYECDEIASPFILGVLRPRIYLPSGLSEEHVAHVLAHERAHLHRRDHLIKPLAYLLLSLFWFQPLLLVAYVLLCRDVERACDERVIRRMSDEQKCGYSEALLHCSLRRRLVTVCPLAFGEVSAKERIRAVLSYKKPTLWIMLAAVVAALVVAVCFLTDPQEKTIVGETDPDRMSATQIALMDSYPEYFGLDATNGLDVYVWQMAANSYSFGLLPHSETEREWISEELMDLRGMRADQMRAILATYDVDEDDIRVIPWQNPFSSYIAAFYVIREGEDIEQKRADYIALVRDMLFGEQAGDVLTGGASALDENSLYAPFEVTVGQIEAARKRYPEYFGLDATHGLRVYVSQLARHSYSCYLVANDGSEVDGVRLISMRSTSIDEMKAILTSYEIPHTAIALIPYTVMYSSYAPPIHDPNYMTELNIRFQRYDAASSGHNRPFDSAAFDIDGDGVVEECTLHYGATSGITSYAISAREPGRALNDYFTIFAPMKVKDLSFATGEDGVVRLYAKDAESGEEHLYDIAIEYGGSVIFTENGHRMEQIY